MAYDSTNLALHSAQIGRAHTTAGFPFGGNVWRYSSTADPLATVIATSYFSDGHKRGMRKYDLVLFADIGTTLNHTMMVTAVTTGAGATAGNITSSST